QRGAGQEVQDDTKDTGILVEPVLFESAAVGLLFGGGLCLFVAVRKTPDRGRCAAGSALQRSRA
ncbi:hypothetical protein, partial [Pseudomonas aeruginosa]|uniref:hypothetical protein n=1 Tax=Pseudomonas aeruginosa TaxID=287 RepID=UPI00397AD2D3